MRDINEIKTKKDLVSYIFALSQDYFNNKETWTNKDIGSYLDALATWVKNKDAHYKKNGGPVDWSDVADMLLAAKVCESKNKEYQ